MLFELVKLQLLLAMFLRVEKIKLVISWISIFLGWYLYQMNVEKYIQFCCKLKEAFT